MEKIFEEPKSGEHYLGKVRIIEDTVVRVSIFAPDEYVFDVGIGHFPAKPQIGDVFKYLSNGQIVVVKPRELSELELKSLMAEVERELPIDEF